jgi:hypothetical protein
VRRGADAERYGLQEDYYYYYISRMSACIVKLLLSCIDKLKTFPLITIMKYYEFPINNDSSSNNIVIITIIIITITNNDII